VGQPLGNADGSVVGKPEGSDGSVLGNPEGMGGSVLGNPEGRIHGARPPASTTGAAPPSAGRTGTGCRGTAGAAVESAGTTLVGVAGIAGALDAVAAGLGEASLFSAPFRKSHATPASGANAIAARAMR